MKEEKKFPIQPIKDFRFVKNSIVEDLLESHTSMNMNTIAIKSYSSEERMQFAQLIGYSLNGYGDLDYVTDEKYNEAEVVANGHEQGEGATISFLRGEVLKLEEKIRKIRGIVE